MKLMSLRTFANVKRFCNVQTSTKEASALPIDHKTMAASLLSKTFRSTKPHSSNLVPSPPSSDPVKLPKSPSKIALTRQQGPSSSSTKSPVSKSQSKNSWAVYLILSTNPPIKTYVGVTNNFSRRLEQHNGELKGGAKATRAGKPWISACLVQGFGNKSKACEFESKWKIASRKLPRKRNRNNEEQSDSSQVLLLRHRYAALNQVKDLIDCSHLLISWHLDPN